VIKFIQSILEQDQLLDELIIQAFKLFFPDAPPLLFPPLSSTTTAHIEDTGIEAPAELDELYTDHISYLDGLPPACSTPHKLDGPSEQELQQVYDDSETSAALLATAQLYLGSEHTINHYTNDNGFETQWEQHLDPVHPPPPPDAEVL
jgi:hypothetical protein